MNASTAGSGCPPDDCSNAARVWSPSRPVCPGCGCSVAYVCAHELMTASLATNPTIRGRRGLPLVEAGGCDDRGDRAGGDPVHGILDGHLAEGLAAGGRDRLQQPDSADRGDDDAGRGLEDPPEALPDDRD